MVSIKICFCFVWTDLTAYTFKKIWSRLKTQKNKNIRKNIHNLNSGIMYPFVPHLRATFSSKLSCHADEKKEKKADMGFWKGNGREKKRISEETRFIIIAVAVFVALIICSGFSWRFKKWWEFEEVLSLLLPTLLMLLIILLLLCWLRFSGYGCRCYWCCCYRCCLCCFMTRGMALKYGLLSNKPGR